MSTLVSARTRRHAGREQGLKILAREVTNIAVQKAPPSQANWLWDCTTPQAALAGSFVSVSALSFSRKTAATGPFLFQFVRALRIDPALKGRGFQPCRPAVRRNWPSGAEGAFPQWLKPDALRNATGTPEGVPLQNEKVVGTLGVPLQKQNACGTFKGVPPSRTFPSLGLCDGAYPVPHCTTFLASVDVSDVNRH